MTVEPYLWKQSHLFNKYICLIVLNHIILYIKENRMTNIQTLYILTPLFTFIESCSAHVTFFFFFFFYCLSVCLLLDTCITHAAFEASDQSMRSFYINFGNGYVMKFMLEEYFKVDMLIRHWAWCIMNTVANQRSLISCTSILVFLPPSEMPFWCSESLAQSSMPFYNLHFCDCSNQWEISLKFLHVFVFSCSYIVYWNKTV